jgi:hypothetical protein
VRIALLATALLVAGCETIAPGGAAPRANAPLAGVEWGRAGFSGVAPFGASMLVVHDAKFDANQPRLGVLELPAIGPVRYRAVSVVDWRERIPDDLESLCTIPGKRDEFLAAESSHRTGIRARLFRLRVVGNTLDGWRAEVLASAELPRSPEATPVADPANYEGLACLATPDADRIALLLGERGGSRELPRGSIRTGMLKLSDFTLEFADGSFEAAVPGDWQSVPDVRSVADLAIGRDGIVWAIATRDPGDAGPFESRVYAVARVSVAASGVQLTPLRAEALRARLDGIKVEGLALLDDGRAFFVSDDESMGGAFGWLPVVSESTAP